jgi:hypothetical protein
MTTARAATTGGGFLEYTQSIAVTCTESRQRDRGRCPVCERDCMGSALPNLVYTFETCTCPAVPYPHLTEQLWHRTCFQNACLPQR